MNNDLFKKISFYWEHSDLRTIMKAATATTLDRLGTKQLNTHRQGLQKKENTPEKALFRCNASRWGLKGEFV